MSNKAIVGGGNGHRIIDLHPAMGGAPRTVKLNKDGGISHEEKKDDANAQEKSGQEKNDGGQEEKEPIRQEEKNEGTPESSSGDDLISDILP